MFITAVPITKLFAWGDGDSGGQTGAKRDDEPGAVCVYRHMPHPAFDPLHELAIFPCMGHMPICI